MPRPRKSARLWLEPERTDTDGRVRTASVWTILDGGRKLSTGCGALDHQGAEEALALYLAKKHGEKLPEPDMPASKIAIADVLSYYMKDAKVARPDELGSSVDRILDFFGDKPLSYIKGYTCKAFVAHRGTQSGARRDLENLRAAIKLYKADGLCRDDVVVTMPEKHKARIDYFTRDQMAALLWHCYTAREEQKGVPTQKHHRRHAIPFLLVALYTGTRSSRIWPASFDREVGRPWLDLDGGLFYRTPIRGVAAANKRAGAVRIPERLLAHLLRWRDGIVDKDGVRHPRRYLMDYDGRPADPKKAIKRAMVKVFGDDNGYVKHTIRHTTATWLMWAGVDVGDIASYMSMTREMVVEVYGKEHPDADKSAGAAMSDGSAGRRKVGLSRRDPRRIEASRTIPKEKVGTNGHYEELTEA